MAKYDFPTLEPKWQARWAEQNLFAAETNSDKPKYYVLDMFPYPSGAGLHVGHPLGYIATDIVARFKKLKGYNVLHPMGYDAFGLPAENYAIQHGIHPAVTTDKNIKRYQEQIKMLGLAYDPASETVRTCNPDYYKWTQWIFLQLFNSFYNKTTDKAEPIDSLVQIFENEGNANVKAAGTQETVFSAEEWRAYSEKEKQAVLQNYRLAYQSDIMVNWCEAMGTVLANEEVKDGLSERGGHPVVRKPMRQWSLRITAYADRLLNDLNTIDWPSSIKDQQTNWIGRSEGASVRFQVLKLEYNFEYVIKPEAFGGDYEDVPYYIETQDTIEVFTTRPDTIFGATFLVLAPEHELVKSITTDEQRAEVEEYVAQVAARSERERMAEKRLSGVFTGAYVKHPFKDKKIPVWISEYVLAGYGTGAIMAVPAHDERDFAFAKHFGLPIKEVVLGGNVENEAFAGKEGVLVNSDFLNGLDVKAAIRRAIEEIEKRGIGKGKTTYRLRDATFSRQRYWGEPFPIVYRDGVPYGVDESELPVTLPEVESYKPTGTGESPIAAVTDWVNRSDGSRRETDTMPGWAGSSWYFFRYVDPFNENRFADPEKVNYWLPVDLYVGGSEHAVGHLLYCRFWTKVLFDLGYLAVNEPVKKLVNQGMIQGVSSLAYRKKDENVYVSYKLLDKNAEYTPIHVDVNFVEDGVLDLEKFKHWRPEAANAEFVLDAGKFECGSAVEKMSKSLYNVVNPDTMCAKYGADCFRLYEMFLGPLEQHKPWSTQSISGVAGFLRKLVNLYLNENNEADLSDEAPNEKELKILHQTIKKVAEDIERLSFNTTVPQFMIFVNEISALNCRKRAVLEPFLITLAPYAPHLAEELWEKLGHTESIFHAAFPDWNADYLVESSIEYPIQINGKLRMKMNFAAAATSSEIETAIRSDENVQKYFEGREMKKVVVVPGKIVNVVG